MPKKVIIHADGGSRGNPGPAAAGFTLTTPDGVLIQAKGILLGKATNNFAEYSATIKALEAAIEVGADQVTVFSDSQLLVRQINGQYKEKSEQIKPLFTQAVNLLQKFKIWKVQHIPREKNEEADELVNQALDAGHDVESTPVQTPPNKKPIQLGVLISGGGTTLINIQNLIDQGQLNAEVAVVISSLSKVAGVKRAENAGNKVKIIRKKDSTDINEFSKSIEETLTAANVDLVIQAGWLCLWKIPNKYKNRVMNIHPALLPAFGGKGMWGHNVHEAVLRSGAKISGCTVHFCTNEYDKGPIIVQRSCPVKEDDTPDTLTARVFEQECIAYPEAIKLFADNRLLVYNNKVKVE